MQFRSLLLGCFVHTETFLIFCPLVSKSIDDMTQLCCPATENNLWYMFHHPQSVIDSKFEEGLVSEHLLFCCSIPVPLKTGSPDEGGCEGRLYLIPVIGVQTQLSACNRLVCLHCSNYCAAVQITDAMLHPQTASALLHNLKVPWATFRKTFPLYMSISLVPYVVSCAVCFWNVASMSCLSFFGGMLHQHVQAQK